MREGGPLLFCGPWPFTTNIGNKYCGAFASVRPLVAIAILGLTFAVSDLSWNASRCRVDIGACVDQRAVRPFAGVAKRIARKRGVEAPSTGAS